MKKHFWKLEYSITIFVFLGLLLLFVPINFENYWQAKMINRWNDKYNRIEYMFTVINAQKNEEILKSFAKRNSSELRQKMLFQLVKPYLRIHEASNLSRKYKPKYMNNTRVRNDDKYYFDELYYSEKMMTIIGLKNVKTITTSDPWFMMLVDINGLLPPNTWGKDIFGIYIYNEGKIEPFGYRQDLEEMKKDCSNTGLGLSCSYYYIIGGKFSD